MRLFNVFVFLNYFFSSGAAFELDVKFDDKLKCLTVTGCINNVEAAMKFIKTNYIDVICTDKLEIVQPGDLICYFYCKRCDEYFFRHLQIFIPVFSSAYQLRY